jgi:hypothetical protein
MRNWNASSAKNNRGGGPLRIDYLEKLIEIASQDLKTDLKKTTDTPHSNTSGPTGKTRK